MKRFSKTLFLLVVKVLYLFSLLFSINNSSEKLLFKFPKKLELAENSTINQEENIVNWQDKDKINHTMNPVLFTFSDYKIQNRGFYKQYGRSC